MPSDYEISTDPTRLDVDVIHRFLTTSYWAEGRSRAAVEQSMAHSLCFGVYEGPRQIGFARVVSDRAVFAYLMDVFVLPERQGRGIGKALMRSVLAHPDLQGLRLFALRTRDAQGLYAQFGFGPLSEPEMMAIESGRPKADERAAPHAAFNALGQPVGPAVAAWRPPPPPPREPVHGRFCSLQPVDERIASDLYAAVAHDVDGRSWTYLPYGPFASEHDYRPWLRDTCLGADPLFYAVVEAVQRRAVGAAAYLRIQPASGSIEVGHVHFSPLLQRTPAATEAMYLMMRRVFELGYRRYEWKCDALNAPSRRAAQRLGFSFEGLFRQATVYKGRSRDTAWYSVIDREWPALSQAFEAWLDPGNFDREGRQRTSLTALTRPLLAARG